MTRIDWDQLETQPRLPQMQIGRPAATPGSGLMDLVSFAARSALGCGRKRTGRPGLFRTPRLSTAQYLLQLRHGDARALHTDAR